MAETPRVKEIMLAIGNGACRIFRMNTGMGWVGTIVRKTGLEMVIQNYRPLRAGLSTSAGDIVSGASDLIGWRSVVITPEMVGTKIAQLLVIEVKDDRKYANEKQRNFIEQVKMAGGRAGVARNAEDARAIIAI